MDDRTEQLREMQRKANDRGFKDGWKCGCELGFLAGVSFVWIVIAVLLYNRG